MRFFKHAVLMTSLLFSAVAMLAILSLRTVPAQEGGGGAGFRIPLRNGDVNCDGRLDVSDPIFLLNTMFRDGREPCAFAQDINVGPIVEQLQKMRG